jgi:hypothetical protein
MRDKWGSETGFDRFGSLPRAVSASKPLLNQKKKGPSKGPSSVSASIGGGANDLGSQLSLIVTH